MKDTQVVYIGIDVSKGTLDIDTRDFGAMRIANTPVEVRKALSALARKAGPEGTPQVCFESTGPYTGALVAECQAKAIAYSILNPHKVACFARSVAHAKTDRADASAIRRYAEVKRPAPARPPGKALARLDEFILAREATVKSLVALKSVLGTITDPAVMKHTRRIVAILERKVAGFDRLIAEAVQADAEISGLVGALGGVKGVGALTAAKAAAWMPEIGTPGRRKAAALTGLAPHTRESGQWKGKAGTGGGRKHVRDALYMAALSAITHDPVQEGFYRRLRDRGAPGKVALTAVMRKLVCHLDAVARAHYARRGGQAA